ncbi:hypothetical protein KUCAC02_011714 [Chaenocephalus aceratus]|uniref:Uncharacterized protein n=1 Tax=Chaenocephalus aceratus TaxID=36190 RepID=A0ACB9WWL6_CHAAC|nr:hypothetical protein KUCAC02_011714 [Chaenocephalus aceratus]
MQSDSQGGFHVNEPLTLLPPPSLSFPQGDVVFGLSAGRLPGPVLSLWMAPSMLCPAVIEHYEVFHASVH